MSDDTKNEPTTTPEAGSEPQVTPEGSPQIDPELARVAGESKKYRKRAQEAESERDTLRQRVDSYQRTEAASVVGEHLADADDFWLRHDIADYRTDDGELDTEALSSAAAELAKSKPHLSVPQRITRDRGAGVRRSAPRGGESAGDVIKNAARSGTRRGTRA